MTTVGERQEAPALAPAAALLLGAAVLFAAANVAWRYGEGSAFALAAQRALIGALLFAPAIFMAVRDGRVKAVLASRAGVIAIVCSSATMPASALLFRTLTGPQAALCLAATPAVLVVANLVLGRGNRGAVPWVLASVVAAVTSVLLGGLGAHSITAYWPALVNMALDVTAILAMERARDKHGASVLVGLAMLFAAVWCSLVALVVTGGAGLPSAGLLAASVVGVFGTTARVMRAHALPRFGAATTFSLSQVTVVLTAVGGVVIFDDLITWPSAVLGLFAAAAAVMAMLRSKEEPESSVPLRR